MKRIYKVTLKTRDIFNFTTAVMLKQYEPNPTIIGTYESKEGQLVDLKISCTRNEKLVIGVALSDYILRFVEIDENNKELDLIERIFRGWMLV